MQPIYLLLLISADNIYKSSCYILGKDPFVHPSK